MLKIIEIMIVFVLLGCSNETPEPRAKSIVKSENKPAVQDSSNAKNNEAFDADAKVDIQGDEKSKIEKLNGCEVNDNLKAIFALGNLAAKSVLGKKDDSTSKLILAVMDLVSSHFSNIQTGTISEKLSSDAADLISLNIAGLSENQKLAIHVGISAALKALNVKCTGGGLQALDAVSFVIETIKTIPEELRSDSSQLEAYLPLIMEALEILN